MPAITSIPQQLRKGLKLLEVIDDKAFQELLSGLRDARVSVFNPDYIDRLVPNTVSISRNDATTIVETVYQMSIVYLVNGISPSVFVSDIADALDRGLVKDIVLTPETRNSVVERLEMLLSLDVFKVGAKATNVLNEHEHTLTSARILTDIRPVFDDDVTSAPLGMIIVHTLKIEYREGSERKEFFVAIDTHDIQLLTEILERAKLKAEGLKTILESAQIRQFDFDEGKL